MYCRYTKMNFRLQSDFLPHYIRCSGRRIKKFPRVIRSILRALQQNEVWLLGNNALSDSAHKKSHALLFWIFKHTQIAWKIFFWNQNLNMVASKRQNFRNFSSYLFGDSTNRGEIIRITSLSLSISWMSFFFSTPWCSAYQQKSLKKIETNHKECVILKLQ